MGDERIAIIGMGCRFPPRSTNPEAYFRDLIQCVDAVVEVPKSRWDLRHFSGASSELPGRGHARHGGFLEQSLEHFDPIPFGMSAREAEALDPLQRLLLEVTWEAFERGGIPIERLAGTATGVFVGGFTLDNMLLQMASPELFDGFTATSVMMTLLANRLSHVFDLRGPSVSLDTACSSSLTALHLAVSAMRRGDCEMAIVGGANAIFWPSYSTVMAKAHLLSADGRCRAFSHDGQGYVRGEGAGVIVLKPLARALADGDRIEAIVVETGANQDGRTPGISRPNGVAQRDLIRAVYERAGISPRDIVYVEAHGTGTPIGDPTEFNALQAVFAERPADDVCWVGSVKTNIGHLEAAAGIAGLIKAALVLREGVVPPNLHFDHAHPDIALDKCCLRVPTQVERLALPRGACASVNSFGYGGANAHAVLERFEDEPDDEKPQGSYTLALSAHSEEGLTELARSMRDALCGRTAPHIADVAHTLGARRSHHPYRLAILAESSEQARQALSGYADGWVGTGAIRLRSSQRRAPPLAFVFSGMGPQWWGMDAELIAGEPVYRAHVERCDAILARLSGCSILATEPGAPATAMIDPNVAQPANFVLQTGIAAWLASVGIEPDVVLGHSVGEVSAAFVAGMLSLEDALQVVYHRSRLQQSFAGRSGGMLAVGANAESIAPLLRDRDVCIAAVNSRHAVTLAGSRDSLLAVQRDAERAGLFARPLDVAVAYHSASLDPMEPDLMGALRSLQPAAGRRRMFSTVTGDSIEGTQLTAQHWWKNTRDPVLFSAALKALLAEKGEALLLQVGPQPVLKRACEEVAHECGETVHAVATLRRELPARQCLREAVAGVYCMGRSVEWNRLNHARGRVVPLPTYPWQRSRLWRESARTREWRLGRDSYCFLARKADGVRPAWDVELCLDTFPFLRDHRLNGRAVFPGAGFVEAALAAVLEIYSGGATARLTDIRFDALLALAENEVRVMRTEWDAEARTLRLASRSVANDRDAWVQHATVGVALEQPQVPSVPAQHAAFATEVDVASFYGHRDATGLEYGPHFQTLAKLWRGDHGFRAHLRRAQAETNRMALSPMMLDGCLQAVLAAGTAPRRYDLPIGIERLDFYTPPSDDLVCVGMERSRSSARLVYDFDLSQPDGTYVAALRGVTFRGADRPWPVDASSIGKLFHACAWIATPASRGHDAPNCLILADAADKVTELTDTLSRRGSRATLAHREKLDAPHAALLDDALAQAAHDGVRAIFCLWTLQPKVSTEVIAGCLDVSVIVTDLVRHMYRHYGQRECALAFITRGLNVLGVQAADSIDLRVSPLSGLVELVRNEYPSIRARVVDLDPHESGLEPLADEITSLDTDVCYRAGVRHVWSLRQMAETEWRPLPVATSTAIPLTAPLRPGARFVHAPAEPQMAEVAVRVTSAALDDRDGSPIIADRMGEIVAAGQDARSLPIGSRVLVDGEAARLQTVVCVDASEVRRAPNLAWDQCLNLSPLVVAWRGLRGVRAGHNALVVGADRQALAFVAVARHLGARVAVVADESFRARAHTAGAEAFFDVAVPELLVAIRGALPRIRVLAGAAAHAWTWACAELVEPLGRCIVVGDAIPNRRTTSNVEWLWIHAGRWRDEAPDDYEAARTETLAALESGSLSPQLAPSIGIDEWLREPGNAPAILEIAGRQVPADHPRDAALWLDRNGCYVVTGGTRGFGLAVGLWLARHGARRVVLVGVSGNVAATAAAAIERAQRAGSEIVVERADVSIDADVRNLIARCDQADLPLRGIFHAAMVLDDAPLAELDRARFERVFAPKARGAWLLHNACQTLAHGALRQFVLFSSVSALIGNPGQGAYVAANAFLDGLGRYRRALGLPACVVDLGVIAGVGVVARNQRLSETLAAAGMNPIAVDDVLSSLDMMLTRELANAAFLDVDWSLLFERRRALATSTRFATFATETAGHTSFVARLAALRQSLQGLEPARITATLTVLVCQELASVLRCDWQTLDQEKPVTELGLDSLMTLDFATRLEARFGLALPAQELMRGPSARGLSDWIATRFS